MLFFTNSEVSGDYILDSEVARIEDLAVLLRLPALRAKMPPCLEGRFYNDRAE
jgi:hypothetical protein